jgi:hypothetical protein
MGASNWKHITLGELYRGGIAKFRRGRRAFKHYSPLKLDLTAAQNLWGVVAPRLMAPILYVLEGFRDNRLLPHANEDSEASFHSILQFFAICRKILSWYTIARIGNVSQCSITVYQNLC